MPIVFRKWKQQYKNQKIWGPKNEEWITNNKSTKNSSALFLQNVFNPPLLWPIPISTWHFCAHFMLIGGWIKIRDSGWDNFLVDLEATSNFNGWWPSQWTRIYLGKIINDGQKWVGRGGLDHIFSNFILHFGRRRIYNSQHPYFYIPLFHQLK